MTSSYGSTEGRFIGTESSNFSNEGDGGKQKPRGNHGHENSIIRDGNNESEVNQSCQGNQVDKCNQGGETYSECKGNQGNEGNNTIVGNQARVSNQGSESYQGYKALHRCMCNQECVGCHIDYGYHESGENQGNEGYHENGVNQRHVCDQESEIYQGRICNQGSESNQECVGEDICGCFHECGGNQRNEGNQGDVCDQDSESNQGREGNQARTVIQTYNHVTECVFIAVAPAAVYAQLMISYLNNQNNHPTAHDEDKNLCVYACVIYFVASLVILVFIILSLLTENRVWRRVSEEYQRLLPHAENALRSKQLNVRDAVFAFLSAISVIQILTISSFGGCNIIGRVAKIMFCLLQLLLILAFRRKPPLPTFGQYLFASVLAGNACLFVDFVGHACQLPDTFWFMTKIGDLFYVCTVHFALFSTCLIYKLLHSNTSEPTNSDAENIVIDNLVVVQHRGSIQDEIYSTAWSELSKVLRYLSKTLRVISYHSFYPCVVLFMLVISIDVFVRVKYANFKLDARNSTNSVFDPTVFKVYMSVQSGTTYCRGAITFILLLVSTYEKPSARKLVLVDKITLLLSLAPFLTYYILVTVHESANFSSFNSSSKAYFVIYAVFIVIELYCQTRFILQASSFQIRSPLSLRQIFIRGTTEFVCMMNLLKWIRDSFLFQNYFSQFENGDAFSWQKLMMPFSAIAFFYRLFSALLCYEIVQRIPRQ